MALALGNSVHSNDSSSSRVLSLTAGSGSVILAVVTTNASGALSVTSANGETFTQHAATGSPRIEIFSGVTSSAWSSNNVTVSTSGSGYTTVDLFEIQGADTSNIFDDNASVPVTGSGFPLSISTDAADTIIVGAARYATWAGTATPGTGFTLVSSSNYQLVEYQIVSATQSSLSVDDSSADTTNGAVATAIRAAGASGGGGWNPVWATRSTLTVNGGIA